MRRPSGLPPSHRATTVELRALYPFVVPGGLGVHGCYVGLDASGQLFSFDPWECYARGKLTGPNMVVVGQIGRGKSAFVKSFVWRQLCFGRRCWVLDPKGEYGPLAAAWGVAPLCLGPGLGLRLNPLDVAGEEGQASPAGPGAHARRAALLGALLESSLGRPLGPSERAAADVALGAVEGRSAVPTLPAVAEALLAPGREGARLVGTDVEGLRRDGRQVALELRRLVRGDLAGMFDGETSAGVDLGSRLVVLDLSRVYGSPALGLLMVCALSWLQSMLMSTLGPPGHAGTTGQVAAQGADRPSGGLAKYLVVLDEAWAVLSHLATARWLQSAFKLSRAFGVANIVVLHRLSDLKAAGAEGSEQRQLAEGLLADAETRVCFAQAPGEAELTASLLGLSPTESQLVTQLPRGVSLWRVGEEAYLVYHDLSAEERCLADTDAPMRPAGVAASTAW